MKRNHKAEKALKCRNQVLAAVVHSGDVTRFRSRTQRSEKSKRAGSRARRKAAQSREEW
jgi:hypothetical protein